jgi:hypothetical protein
MGDRINGPWAKIIGGITTLLMLFAGGMTIWSLFFR